MKLVGMILLGLALAGGMMLAQLTARTKAHPMAAENTESKEAGSKLAYPTAPRDNVVDDLFGVKVPAPYRWMEDLNSPAVKSWVDAENKLTFSYLDNIPERGWIREHLTKLWNYEKVGVPRREG
ncbi:MAG TPA: S9 family peptidase, partial [Nitrospirota bacterium]